jgi:hypothetical protein
MENSYGKGNDLRFTWRLRNGTLSEEVFECEKAGKLVKRIAKWTHRRAEEEAKVKKKEAELLEAAAPTPSKGDSGKNLKVKDPEKQERSLIRAFSQSKLSQLVSKSSVDNLAGNSSQAAGLKTSHGGGSLRPGGGASKKDSREIIITRPTSMVHKMHVDRELVWSGEAEFQLAEKIGGGCVVLSLLLLLLLIIV